MKTLRLTFFLLLLTTTCFFHRAFSADYTQWRLPEGAIKRLGKGMIYGNISFSQDGSLLAVASSIGVWVYDGYTGEEVGLFTNHAVPITSVAVSPDGKTVACSNASEFYVWDVDTGNLKLTISAHTSDIESVAYSPDGKTLATVGGYDATARGYDTSAKIWNASTGALIRSIDANTDFVNTVAFSPDGKTLATGGEDDEISTIKLWDTSNGELKSTLTMEEESVVWRVREIAFSPDGSKIASCEGWWHSGDTTVKIWDVASSQLQSTLRGHVQGVYCISFSADGNTLASGSIDRTVCLWDVESGTYKTTLTAHRNRINNVAFSPDGRTLASSSQDGTVILWDAESLKKRTTITEHTAWGAGIAFSPDGKKIVTGCSDTTVRIWDTFSGRNVSTLRGHRGEVVSVAYSSDGKTIASSAGFSPDRQWVYGDDTIRLWDAETGTQKSVLIGHGDYGGSLTFSPIDNILTGTRDSKLIMWDTTTGHSLWTLSVDDKDFLTDAFSPDGKILGICSQREVNLYDLTTRQLIKSFSVPYQSYSNITFSPDGKAIARAGSDDEVHILRVNSGDIKTISIGHSGRYPPVSAVFGPDNRTLITGNAEDRTIRFWDVVNGEQKAIIHSIPNGVHQIRFSPDGSTFATDTWGGTILIWDYHSIINPTRHRADINGDGIVDIIDLVYVARNFGQIGANLADVNGDGIVDIADLLLVVGALDVAIAAPLAKSRNLEITFTRTDIQNWLSQARQLNTSDIISQKGIQFLEQLLLALTPEKTTLLPNYPNPFNPETWIPYQLSESSDVTIEIFSSEGKLIRTLDLGEKTSGLYQSKGTAAYWDGKNEIGEPVASGVYYYTLTAEQYSATRKMLIRK